MEDAFFDEEPGGAGRGRAASVGGALRVEDAHVGADAGGQPQDNVSHLERRMN